MKSQPPTSQEFKAFWSAMSQTVDLATLETEGAAERARVRLALDSAQHSLDALIK